MKYSWWILIILWSWAASAQLVISARLNRPTTSGDVVEVELKLTDRKLMDVLSPSNLQSSFIPESLWFMSVSTWQLKTDGLQTSARVVVGKKFDPDKLAVLQVGAQAVEVRFVGWQFSPGSDTGGDFLYQEVPWYYRPWWKKYGLFILLFVSLISVLAARFFLTWRRKKQARELKLKQVSDLVQKLERACDMTALSQVWGSRDEYSKIFPSKHSSLRAFYDVLNQYQFKPYASDSELDEVLQAKRRLIDELARGEHGV